MLESEASFELESLLRRVVCGARYRLKADRELRDAVLRLLDILVAAGVSTAYRMRDDFVTLIQPGSVGSGDDGADDAD